MIFSTEYLAGLVDGEGHICLSSSNVGKYQKFYPRIQVTNTNHSILEELLEMFGGRIYQKTPSKSSIGRNWSIGYDWILTGDKARALILSLVPYLWIKKKIAIDVLFGDQRK